VANGELLHDKSIRLAFEEFQMSRPVTQSRCEEIHFCELTRFVLWVGGILRQHPEDKSAENSLPRLSALSDCKLIKRASVCPYFEVRAHDRKSTPIPFRRGRSAKDGRKPFLFVSVFRTGPSTTEVSQESAIIGSMCGRYRLTRSQKQLMEGFDSHSRCRIQISRGGERLRSSTVS
jgi:hypothetical protein